MELYSLILACCLPLIGPLFGLVASSAEWRVSPVFLRNQESAKRITINQGGSRSGKTYSILQVLIVKYALCRKGLIIDIVRKTKAELRETVYLDFIEILTEWGLYREENHNKSNLTYKLNGNLFRFIGMDKAQKKKGAKRDVLYINEANGLSKEDWLTLQIRTKEKIFIDYNPSEYFWVNELILEKDPEKFDLIHSTYLDNADFLPAEQIADIENLINVDSYWYNVYVLGILATMKGKIYDNCKKITLEEYEAIQADEIFYGLDWGYEHYSVIVEIKWANEQVYERCLWMKTKKHVEDMIQFCDESGIDQSCDMYPDPAVPPNINKFENAGYNMRRVDKDVKSGIAYCQSLKRNIVDDKESIDSQIYVRQMDRYKLKQTNDGKVMDGVPVKLDDDGPDASRYALYNHLKKMFNPFNI